MRTQFFSVVFGCSETLFKSFILLSCHISGPLTIDNRPLSELVLYVCVSVSGLPAF